MVSGRAEHTLPPFVTEQIRMARLGLVWVRVRVRGTVVRVRVDLALTLTLTLILTLTLTLTLSLTLSSFPVLRSNMPMTQTLAAIKDLTPKMQAPARDTRVGGGVS